MHGSSAGYNNHALDVLQHIIRDTILCEVRHAVLNTRHNGPLQSLRLLIDLLQHEMRVSALLCRIDIPVNGQDLRRHLISLHILNADGILVHSQDMILRHYEILPGIRDQSRQVRCNDGSLIEHSCNQRADISNTVDHVRMIAEHDAECKCTGQQLHRLTDGHDGVALVDLIQQCCHNLGVRLGLQFLGEAVLYGQLPVVLDDTVMDQGNGSTVVGMRICLRYTAVGCPAGMTDAAGSRSIHVLSSLTQLFYLTGLLLQKQTLLIIQYGDACAVISTVLKLLKTADQNILCGEFPCKSNNSTHNIVLLSIRHTGKCAADPSVLSGFLHNFAHEKMILRIARE